MMKTNSPKKFQPILAITISILLILSVGVTGVLLLLSGQPGTGMMEERHHEMLLETESNISMHATMMPTGNLGIPANTGIFGGYTGTIGVVMILVQIILAGILVLTLFRGRPTPPQTSTCWNCNRPLETDWLQCPYCGTDRMAGQMINKDS